MKKNICIVHFNTPALTRCLVQSINKYTPDANIYIFDNSDKLPFINVFDNVTVLDNTKGQLVDFDEVLSKFPMRIKSRGKTNNYGSAKHSISIQKCVELIEDGFILLDSDVLLKRDISPVWNENYVWVAGVEDWTNKTLVGAKKRKRVCPFLLYMNTKKMNELGIAFYDDTHMLGFNNGPKCEEYETGVWFYEATPKDKRRVINYNDYIVHFRAASWLDDARTKQRYKQIEPKKWLLNNRKYWADPNVPLPKDWYEKYGSPQEQVKQMVDKIDFASIFDHIYCLHYLPSEARLQKLKDELSCVGIDENAKYFSWVYDYPTSLLDIVYNDNRVNMSTPLKSSSRSYIKRVSMKHYEIIKEAYSLGYNRILILEDDERFHKDLEYIKKMLANIPNSDIVMFDKMTCSVALEATKYKRYIKTLPADSLYGSMNDSGVFFIFCSCYSLNRKAMKQIIDTQEQSLQPPDTPLNDKTLTGSFALINIAIQDPSMKTREVESYSKIDLDVSVYGAEEKTKTNPKPTAPVSQPPAKGSEKKIGETGGASQAASADNKKPKQVVFRMPTTPQSKRKIEPTPKPASQSKRPIVLDKRKRTHTRILVGKSVGYNKLYET